VITNERQYRITKAQLKRFEDELAVHDARTSSANVDPLIHTAMRDALASEADELRGQLEHYEQLRDGQVTGRELDSLRDLPTGLERLQDIFDALDTRIRENVTYSSAA